MASMCILLIFTVISISIGNAKTADFISLKCKAEKLGQYGQQSLLECVIDTPHKDTVIRVVTWKKASSTLLVFNKGAFTVEEGYSFAEPSWNNRSMNVSLLINSTTVEHAGRYECMVMTDDGDADNSASLKVTAKYSEPTILSNPEARTLNTGGTLTCESEHGYPKGELRWFDESNTELTHDSQMEAKQTEGGLFQLSSTLHLGKGSDVSKYTCSVFNGSGGKEEETAFTVHDPEGTQGSRKELSPATQIAAPVVVIGSLIVGLLILLLIYRKRQSQQARRHSTTPLMGTHHGVRQSDVEEGDDK